MAYTSAMRPTGSPFFYHGALTRHGVQLTAMRPSVAPPCTRPAVPPVTTNVEPG